MSDRLRVLEALRQASWDGLRSLDMRRLGLTGNPSERIRELRAEGFVISARPYTEGKRRGKVYVLEFDPVEGSARSFRASRDEGASSGTDAGEPTTEEKAGATPPNTAPALFGSEAMYDRSDFEPPQAGGA